MALPPAIQTVTVNFGPFLDFEGNPLEGTTTFEPTTSIRDEATGTPILAKPVVITWDSDGMGSKVLPATNSTGLNVTQIDGSDGFRYRVTHRVKTQGVKNPDAITISLPASAPLVDLDMLVPTTALNGVVISQPAVQSVAGLSGVVSLEQLSTALDVPTAAELAEAPELRAAFAARGTTDFTGTPGAPFLEIANASDQASLHLTQGVGFTGAYVMGIGNDNGDKPGLLISNKAAGKGQVIKQNSTISSATAYGLQLDQQSTQAAGVRLEMNVDGGADTLQLLNLVTQSSKATKLLYVGDAAGQIGFIRAIDGVLQWQRDVRITDNPANSAARYLEMSTSDAANSSATSKNYLGATSHTFFTGTGSAGQYWPYRFFGSGSTFSLQTAGALTAATPTDPRPSEVSAWNSMLAVKNNQIGFFGATPVARPARPTDVAGVIAALAALGLTA